MASAAYKRHLLDEARESVGKAVGCVFAMLAEIMGTTLGQPHFGNAAAFHRWAEMNADYALECAAKAVR